MKWGLGLGACRLGTPIVPFALFFGGLLNKAEYLETGYPYFQGNLGKGFRV